MSTAILASLAKKVGQTSLLDEAEEVDLIRAYRETGDTAALERLVRSHLPLIFGCARRLKVDPQFVEDLINEGVIGFIRAVDNFDETKGRRLNVLAKFHVKARMADFVLANLSQVRPAPARGERNRFLHIRKLVEQVEEDRLMSPEETSSVAQQFAISDPEGVKTPDVGTTWRRVHSFESRSFDGETTNLLDVIPDESPHPEDVLIEKDERESWTRQMRLAMTMLQERERRVLFARRLKDPPTPLELLAAEFGVSKGRISQIEQQAFERLKSFIRSQPSLIRHAGQDLLNLRSAAAIVDQGNILQQIDQLSYPAYVTDESGLVIHYNKAAIDFAGGSIPNNRMYGVVPRLETLNGEYLPPEDSPAARSIKERKAVRGVIVVNAGIPEKRTSFLPFPTPLYDKFGRYIGMVNVMQPTESYRSK